MFRDAAATDPAAETLFSREPGQQVVQYAVWRRVNMFS
jgi:hypothetical protein